MPFPYAVTVTLIRRVLDGLDGYGNDTYRDEPAAVSGVVFAPGGSSENIQFTDQLNTSATFYFPFGTVIGPLDAISYNGVKYEIRGEPQLYRSPFSNNTAPVEVRASVVTGASA